MTQTRLDVAKTQTATADGTPGYTRMAHAADVTSEIFGTYFCDTTWICWNKVAEQIRVNAFARTTSSMEMQLIRKYFEKVYVNISSKRRHDPCTAGNFSMKQSFVGSSPNR